MLWILKYNIIEIMLAFAAFTYDSLDCDDGSDMYGEM